MRFLIHDDFWNLFPSATIGVVIARGFTNTPRADTAIDQLLAAAVDHAVTVMDGHEPATHPAIAPWRAAYQQFGVKPSKYRSSIESLLRSAVAGRIRPINPLVDLYNTVSLTHVLPCGGEDLAAIQGDLRLTRATGQERFVPLGGSVDEPPIPGEVLYRDDIGAICRCWNWREADRTRLTEATTNAILVIEALPAHRPGQLQAACDQLAMLIDDHLGATTSTAILDRANPMLEIARRVSNDDE
ncbi:MAG TPA: phenylalanine--tRNA ligase beta subunit-related protein [Roseiflexaceae bacterium]|nr:phenylalanine--tRNA ligase beta subunit-related protein [Roseiflexaceae bacterium]HMP41666.1 phenylalanine--tRNA ligase beta subunit-related protein [Roseiflexaceae bacterium]